MSSESKFTRREYKHMQVTFLLFGQVFVGGQYKVTIDNVI